MNSLDIQDGKPTVSGLYIVYVNGPVRKWADRRLMTWAGFGEWMYPQSDSRFRNHVYGWIGPIPALELQEPAEIEDIL